MASDLSRMFFFKRLVAKKTLQSWPARFLVLPRGVVVREDVGGVWFPTKCFQLSSQSNPWMPPWIPRRGRTSWCFQPIWKISVKVDHFPGKIAPPSRIMNVFCFPWSFDWTLRREKKRAWHNFQVDCNTIGINTRGGCLGWHGPMSQHTVQITSKKFAGCLSLSKLWWNTKLMWLKFLTKEMPSKQLAMLRWTQRCVYLDMHDGLQARVSIANDHPVWFGFLIRSWGWDCPAQ